MLTQTELVRVEARRIARVMVKDALRSANIKLSSVSQKEITLAAHKLLHDKPELYIRAFNNIRKRERQD